MRFKSGNNAPLGSDWRVVVLPIHLIIVKLFENNKFQTENSNKSGFNRFLYCHIII
jgi:hypothetical protein